MAHRPSNLDEFLIHLGKTELRQRQNLADELVTYLADPTNSLHCEDLGQLVDSLIPWLDGGNFKIAQSTLEVFTALIGRLGNDFYAYYTIVLPHFVDRLGDSRETVREKAQIVLQKLTEKKVLSAQDLLSRLTPYFKHKNAKLREEILQCIVTTLNEHGSQCLSLKTFIPGIIGLLSDPNSSVRDVSINTLVEFYKHVGDRLRTDLRKREIPAAKMSILEHRFNEARDLGLLLPSASTVSSGLGDEPDTVAIKPVRPIKRNPSIQQKKGMLSDTPISGDSGAGSVSADIFENSFESVPPINIFSPRDLDDNMKVIKQVIGDKDMDWEKRVDALRKIRSLLIADAMSYPMFMTHLKELSLPFLMIIKELRSQVIRETCITIAYMAKIIGTKLDQFSLCILNELIVTLIPNSAKVISSAGTLTIKYIIRNVHSSKLLPPILQNLNLSKSKDVRSTLSEMLVDLLDQWSYQQLEKSSLAIRDVIKKGISDADPDARKNSRKAFWNFKRQFPDLADSIYNNCDATQQRALDRENSSSAGNSIRGSNGSLHSIGTSDKIRRDRYTSSGLKSPASSHVADSRGIGGFRSVSALDSSAVQRAKARAQYSNLARLKVNSGTASLPRARKSPTVSTSTVPQSPERNTRSRGPGVSHSQPTSRSTSPSSRLYSYTNHKPTGTMPKKTSGIPRSLASSRETSPTRSQMVSSKRSLFNSTRRDRPPLNPAKPVMAQKILQQSREAESALADALSPEDHDISGDFSRLTLNRRISVGANTGMREDHSDDSENSSVCSERSFNSYHGPLDSYSWSGSQSRLGSQDISSIIQHCASTNWKERNAGLKNLVQYLKEGNTLDMPELRMITDMFTKMFMDSHTKVFTLFIDTVNELIVTHGDYLHDWLYILLSKLLNKLGVEVLGSIHARITKTLEIINEYFPGDLQMQCLFRFLVDTAQTPNSKSKVASLKFLTNLVTNYPVNSEFYSDEPASKALSKIISYKKDGKSMDIRNHSKLCIVALYNCNSVQMTKLLSDLSKQDQDAAVNIIQAHLKRSTSGTDSPHSPLSCGSPKPLQSPIQSSFQLGQPTGRSSRMGSLDGDNMNSDEVYKNIRKTTAEIQNYSFETSGITKFGRDTTSKDSGISQMSNAEAVIAPNGINGHNADNESSNGGSKTQSADTSKSGTPEIKPESTSHATHISEWGNKSSRDVSQHHINDQGEFVSEKGLREKEVIEAAIRLSNDDSVEYKTDILEALYYVIKLGSCQLPIQHFKSLLRMLLELMGNTGDTKNLLCSEWIVFAMFKRPEMKQCWINYVELLLLKIINNYKVSKEIAHDTDSGIIHMAKVLPLEVAIHVVNPILATGEYPLNLCAVKLLTELAKAQGSEFTEAHLDLVMLNLAKLTDHKDSPMRKAAVFCIVELYLAMEESVKPRLTHLNASKMKLLQVYIDKAKTSKKT